MAQVKFPVHSDGFVNAGEKRLIDYLQNNLPADYWIVPNGEYASKNPQGLVTSNEYDCIVVAPHAIYHIENKDWSGYLQGDDHAWFVNGAERKNPFVAAERKTRILASILRSHNPMWGGAFVQTAVTLSFPSQSKTGIDRYSKSYDQIFLLEKSLIDFIQDCGKVRKSPDAIKVYQKNIVDFLTGSASVAKYRRNRKVLLDYKILEVLQETETFTEYLCQTKFFADRKYKVREFPLDFIGKNKEELESIRKKAENAKYVHEKLGYRGNIVQCSSQLSPDNDFYYEISQYMEESTLRACLKKKTLTDLEKIQIILDIANALKEAHSEGIFHRDVCPENIYVTNSGAALANFRLSWFTEHQEMGYTVATELVPTKDSPYVSPEQDDDDVCASSDLFSLGVVFYELMTGKLPFSNSLSFRLHGGQLDESLMPSKVISQLPPWFDELVRKTVVVDVNNRFASAEEMIEFININLKPAAQESIRKKQAESPIANQTQKKIEDLKPGDQVTPEIVLYEPLGKGGFGRVFKAKQTLQNKFYAIKIFDRDSSAQETINEYQTLNKLSHDNIVKFIYNGITTQGFFYTLMELLEGDNLNKFVEGDLKMTMNELYKMVRQILYALKYMQEQNPPIYHRDVKPNNIIWDKSSRYVLIDFNISSQLDDKAFAGTLPYLAPDLIQGSSVINWDCSADTFALGVSIYQLIAHVYPWQGKYNQPVVGKEPADITQFAERLSPEFASFVMRSIKTDKAERFANAADMLAALEKIGMNGMLKETEKIIRLDPEGNRTDYVDYLNTLYSQSSHGNSGVVAKSKTTNSFDDLTYIKTKLDKRLIDDIMNLKYKLVVITGNAGDGKTAFIKQIESRNAPVQAKAVGNGSTFTINGVKFETNYDGSQDEDTKLNNDVLNSFFEPFFDLDDYTKASEGRIIAINEGRLVDFLSQQPRLKKFETNIEEFFFNEGHVELLPGLIVINLNLRSITAREGDSQSLLGQQIQKMVASELWTKCDGCPVAEKCFIKYNADTFRDSSVGLEVTNRLEWLLRTIVYKRELHVTMRDLRSMIAYMLTRDYSCEQVKKLIDIVQTEGLRSYYWQYYYFNITAPAMKPNVASFDLPTLESNDRLIRMLRETDIAEAAWPAVDRDLYYKEKSSENYLLFSDRKQSLIDEFNAVTMKPIWQMDDEKERNEIECVQKVFIRHQYFEGNIKFKRRLPYRYITDFYESLRDGLDEKTKELKLNESKMNLAKAISISEGCENAELSKAHLLLASSQSNDPISKSYRRFPIDEFELFVNKTDHLTQYVEYESDSFIFRHKTEKHIQLTVSLDLYEMLKFIQNGFSPSVNDLQGRFIELQVFKNLLQSKTYKEIIVTKNNQKFTIIRLDENKHIVFEALKQENN